MQAHTVLVICCTLLFGGCQDSTSDIESEANAAIALNSDRPTTQTNLIFTSQNRQYQLRLYTPESGIPVNAYFDLEVEVRSSVGQSLPYPVELEFSAGMKAHNHGMNTLPRLKQLDKNLFRIEQLLFHMPGEWNLDFRVLRGLLSDHAEIALEVQP